MPRRSFGDERGQEGASQKGEGGDACCKWDAPGEPVKTLNSTEEEGKLVLPVSCWNEFRAILAYALSLEFTSHLMGILSPSGTKLYLY